MHKLFRLLIMLFLAFSFSQCQKDLSYVGEPDPIPVIPEVIVPEPITATLQGNILDENNQPASGVAITVGNKTATTNATGYFRITDAPMDKKSTLVVAEKTGYFKGMRVFSATKGTNQVTIKMIKKLLAATIGAATGGTATLSNGAQVALPAGGVVVASSGAPYIGDVKVYAAYIDPSANDISTTVPGSFAANDKTGKRVILSSFGMMAVELTSNTGEKLQIKTGSKATLTTPIPAARLSTAPATISLWSVDEATGLWKEEGTATKQGNNYVGDVAHFSFWNCDQPLNAVYLNMTIHTADSLPLVYAIVRITRSGAGNITTTYGYTDSLGMVGGLVPANENLLLEVLDPCYSAAYSQTIAPLTQNTNLGIITVSSSSPTINTLKGTLTDCGGLPVKIGYVMATINNMVFYSSVDSLGQFTIKFLNCSPAPNVAQLIGVDQTAQQQSTLTSISLTPPTTNTGNISACGTSSIQYINYTMDGAAYSITSTNNDSMTAYTNTQGGGVTYIMGNSITNNNSIYLGIQNAIATGTYPLISLNVNAFSNPTIISPFNITLTSFPAAIGDFYVGNGSGSFRDAAAVTHNLNVNFKIRRSF